MDTGGIYLGYPAEAHPCPSHSPAVRPGEAGKYPFLVCYQWLLPCMQGTTNLGQQCPSRFAQRNAVFELLFSGRGRLVPTPKPIIEVGPPRRQHLATASPGQQQQPDDVGRLLVGMGVERRAEPGKLVGRQIAPAL